MPHRSLVPGDATIQMPLSFLAGRRGKGASSPRDPCLCPPGQESQASELPLTPISSLRPSLSITMLDGPISGDAAVSSAELRLAGCKTMGRTSWQSLCCQVIPQHCRNCHRNFQDLDGGLPSSEALRRGFMGSRRAQLLATAGLDFALTFWCFLCLRCMVQYSPRLARACGCEPPGILHGEYPDLARLK